jgi:hypothetical protein
MGEMFSDQGTSRPKGEANGCKPGTVLYLSPQLIWKNVVNLASNSQVACVESSFCFDYCPHLARNTKKALVV